MIQAAPFNVVPGRPQAMSACRYLRSRWNASGIGIKYKIRNSLFGLWNESASDEK
jgi:hypothetical protein